MILNRPTVNLMLSLGLIMLAPNVQAQEQNSTAPNDGQPQTQTQSPASGSEQRRQNFRQRMQERRQEHKEEWAQVESTFTPEQKQKVDAIKAQAKKVVEPLHQQLRSLRQQMNSNSSGQNSDNLRSQARDLHKQIRAAVRAEHDQIMSLLTDKQRAMLPNPAVAPAGGESTTPNQ